MLRGLKNPWPPCLRSPGPGPSVLELLFEVLVESSRRSVEDTAYLG